MQTLSLVVSLNFGNLSSPEPRNKKLKYYFDIIIIQLF